MRAMLSVTAVALLMAIVAMPVHAQRGDLTAQEATQLFASPSLTVRMEAAARTWEMISAGRSREVLGDVAFQNALLGLLRRENANHVRRFQDERFGATLGEGWSESYAGILGLSMNVIPRLSPSQQREWLTELIRGSYNPDSEFAKGLAGYGDLSIEALLDLTKNAAIIQQRENAYALLAEMVGLSAFTPAAAQSSAISLSFANRQRALKAVDEGLHHQDDSIPRGIVLALGRHASPETLTILQDFARQNRGQLRYSQRGEHYSSLQAEVEKAIAKVQAGLGQNRR